MRVPIVSETWSAPVTLAAAEVWQCVAGSILVTAEAEPAEEDGLRLDLILGVTIAAGKTVRYRRYGGSAAMLAREALI